MFRIHVSKSVAERTRDCIAKSIYEYLFQHIIGTCNDLEQDTQFIGFLDIAGFSKNLSKFIK